MLGQDYSSCMQLLFNYPQVINFTLHLNCNYFNCFVESRRESVGRNSKKPIQEVPDPTTNQPSQNILSFPLHHQQATHHQHHHAKNACASASAISCDASAAKRNARAITACVFCAKRTGIAGGHERARAYPSQCPSVSSSCAGTSGSPWYPK